MRKLLSCCVIALVAAGCRDATVISPPQAAPRVLITESPSPFREVSAVGVTAYLPDAWQPRLAGPVDDPRQGLLAAPESTTWDDGTPSAGFAAMWIDGTRIGVPSDYYYLAATRSAIDLIHSAGRCSAGRHQVIVDHRPVFAAGDPGSPGDYMATGRGRCTDGERSTRWAYFVSAPGYGPVRELGIPESGLYVVVAVMRDTPRAPSKLDLLLERTEFGGVTVAELIQAARPLRGPALGPI